MRKGTAAMGIAAASALAIYSAGPVMAAVVPTVANDSGNWATVSYSSDNNEVTDAQATTSGSYVTYDLGSVMNFHDVSVTSYASTGTNTPNNFLIQVQPSDDPNAAANTWQTVGTASNIFGYDFASSANINAGRRLEFANQNHRYFRLVTQNPGNFFVSEVQVARQVVIYGSATSAANPYPLNAATDGVGSTFANINSTTASGGGSLVLDVLSPPGQGVSALTLLSRAGGFANTSFPKDVKVYYSSTDDPTNFDTLAADTSINPPSTNDAYLATITLNKTVNARYFELVWANNQLSTSTTQLAEIGVVNSPVPEPASLSLLMLGAGGLLLKRRRK